VTPSSRGASLPCLAVSAAEFLTRFAGALFSQWADYSHSGTFRKYNRSKVCPRFMCPAARARTKVSICNTNDEFDDIPRLIRGRPHTKRPSSQQYERTAPRVVVFARFFIASAPPGSRRASTVRRSNTLVGFETRYHAGAFGSRVARCQSGRHLVCNRPSAIGMWRSMNTPVKASHVRSG
jgi:hypothetical protein